jgi:hypothetical protein
MSSSMAGALLALTTAWRRSPGAPGRVRLIRNHEVALGPALGGGALTYDPAAGGGTTTLEFDVTEGAWVSGRLSLGGTVRNCAGGPTPWRSWLTCEESLVQPGAGQPCTRRRLRL